MDMCTVDQKVVELGGSDLFVMGEKEKKAPTLVEKRNSERKKPRIVPGSYLFRLSNPEAWQRRMLNPDYELDGDYYDEDPDDDHFELPTESVSNLVLLTDEASSSPLMPNKASAPTLVEKRNSEHKKPRIMPGSYFFRLSNPEAWQRRMLDPDYELDGDYYDEDPDDDHHCGFKKLTDPFELLTPSVSKLVLPTGETSSYPLKDGSCSYSRREEKLEASKCTTLNILQDTYISQAKGLMRINVDSEDYLGD